MSTPIKNIQGIAFPSTARALQQTYTSSMLSNPYGKGIVVDIDVTAITSTPSVVFHVQAKDPASGVFTDIVVSAAVTAVSHVRLIVYPGVTVAANTAVSQPVPRYFQITAVHANTNSITYSVGYSCI